jgi:transposase-like protein
VLDILMQSRRSAKVAKRFSRKRLKGLQYGPRVLFADELESYAALLHESTKGSHCTPIPSKFMRCGRRWGVRTSASGSRHRRRRPRRSSDAGLP